MLPWPQREFDRMMSDVTKAVETSSVETPYGLVRYAALGQGDVPLVFVHGYPDNLQIWSRVMRSLADDFRVIAFDWPGLGHSEPIVSGATPFHLGRHFISVLDALELDEVIPVGFDMGAHAVVAACTSHPERIRALVLCNFLADGSVRTSWDIDLMRRLGLNRLVLRYGTRIVFERAQQTFLRRRRSLSSTVRQDMWDGFARHETREHLRKMCAGYDAALPRITRLFSSIEVETLVLWADDDPHFPLDQAHAVSNAIPAATLRVFPGESHWFMWEQPDQVASALRLFAAT